MNALIRRNWCKVLNPVAPFSSSAGLFKGNKKSRTKNQNKMHIAVQGCCHSDLDRIYEYLEDQKVKIDLLIICGDLQTFRTRYDMHQSSLTPKYRKMGVFKDYYEGKREAPCLTLVIGGNHEASNHLLEVFHGGWVAPNIYYLGNTGVVRYKGLRIAGMSGIYRTYNYHKGFHELPPFKSGDSKSVYSVRKFGCYKLWNIQEKVDIFVSHDWPNGIAKHGNLKELLRKKPFFRAEIESGELGNAPAWTLLKKLRPDFYFAAHLHVYYPAIVQHKASEKLPSVADILEPEREESSRKRGYDQVEPDLDFEVTKADGTIAEGPLPGEGKSTEETKTEEPTTEVHSSATVAPDVETNDEDMENIISSTRFLSLDKVVGKRKHFQVLELPETRLDPDEGLTLDREWLAITRATWNHLPYTVRGTELPEDLSNEIQRQREWVDANVTDEDLIIREDFFQCKTEKEIGRSFGSLREMWWEDSQSRRLLADILKLDQHRLMFDATAPAATESDDKKSSELEGGLGFISLVPDHVQIPKRSSGRQPLPKIGESGKKDDPTKILPEVGDGPPGFNGAEFVSLAP